MVGKHVFKVFISECRNTTLLYSYIYLLLCIISITNHWVYEEKEEEEDAITQANLKRMGFFHKTFQKKMGILRMKQ